MDLNIQEELAALRRLTAVSCEPVRRAVWRHHRQPQSYLAGAPHPVAAASPGRRRPYPSGQEVRGRTGQRRRSADYAAPHLQTEAAGDRGDRCGTAQARRSTAAPGTLIIKKYKGQTLQVEVLPEGFLFGGRTYSSLSAVARAITGSHCNGFAFFKLGGGQR